MRYRILVLLGICFAVPAAAASVPETGHDEVVYYADAYAAHYQIPRELVHAIITQESGWNPRAVSPKGAMGLMQLMPATAADYGVRDPFDISENISGGVRYLADLDAAVRRRLPSGIGGILPRQPSQSYVCGLHYSGADVYAYVASVRRLYLAELALHKTPANLVLGGESINEAICPLFCLLTAAASAQSASPSQL